MRSGRRQIKIRKTDYLRVILTDTLPYEVPLLFSNEGLYKYLGTQNCKAFQDHFHLDLFKYPVQKPWSVPYTYRIRKNASEFRSLSVMHPASQAEVAELYRDYDSVILALCQRSSSTLRAPNSIATHFVEAFRSMGRQPTKLGTVEEDEAHGFDPISENASSYFVYRKYNFLYKFFESTEFHRCEKKFKLLLTLDISQCFARIYTHSIAWAVRSKDYAKENTKADRFEQRFDHLMQACNYNETAGIIVGPEVSRIFAEIILQRVDIDLEKRLSTRVQPLLSGEQYELYRYVDDYYVFANDEHCLNVVRTELSNCLETYRLSLNAAKAVLAHRPFSTNETAARIEVAEVVDRFFKTYVVSVEVEIEGAAKSAHRPKFIRNAEATSNALIRDIKRCLKANEVAFDPVANYVFSVTKRLLIKYTKLLPLDELDETQQHRVANFIYALLDTLFFCYGMVTRVRQTYQISEICVLLLGYLEKAPPEILERISTKILGESLSAMRSAMRDPLDESIEILNLLITLRELGPRYLIDQQTLATILRLDLSDGDLKVQQGNFGYFHIATLLCYVQNHAGFTELKEALIRHVNLRFAADDSWPKKAEMVFLFLDFLRCPFVPHDRKLAVATSALGRRHGHGLPEIALELVTLGASQDWFFCWDSTVSLTDILARKQLRTPY